MIAVSFPRKRIFINASKRNTEVWYSVLVNLWINNTALCALPFPVSSKGKYIVLPSPPYNGWTLEFARG